MRRCHPLRIREVAFGGDFVRGDGGHPLDTSVILELSLTNSDV